jgi:hypothetical protein
MHQAHRTFAGLTRYLGRNGRDEFTAAQMRHVAQLGAVPNIAIFRRTKAAMNRWEAFRSGSSQGP